MSQDLLQLVMTVSEVFYQIILPLFSAIIGGWVGGYTQRFLDRKNRKIIIFEKQLFELYGPLNSNFVQIYSYLLDIFKIIESICEYSNINKIPEDGDISTTETVKLISIIKLKMNNLIMDSKVLIRNNPSLIRTNSKELFPEFLQSNLIAEEFLDQLDKQNIPKIVTDKLKNTDGIVYKTKQHVAQEVINIQNELNELCNML